jgi:hypothetical protein
MKKGRIIVMPSLVGLLILTPKSYLLPMNPHFIKKNVVRIFLFLKFKKPFYICTVRQKI